MKNALSIQLGMLCLILLLSGCDFPGGTKEDGPPPSQTRILEVRVEPNPVAVGDTATFTAIIRDSLDTSFQFRWNVDKTPLLFTDENRLQWSPPEGSGRYNAVVNVDNGDPIKRSASREFAIEVTE